MKKKTEKYPVKLRVTHKRATRNYQTIYDLSEAEFKKFSAPRISEQLQQMRDHLKEMKSIADVAIKGIEPFSFEKFEHEFVSTNKIFRRRVFKKAPSSPSLEIFDFTPFEKRFPIFKEDHSRPLSISTVFFSYIKKLLMEARIGSAINYQDTYNSLKKFRGNVLFSEITASYLIQYEHWMLERKLSKTTVGIKLRPLRAIFNEAIEEGIIKRENCYPFGRRKYQIPSSRKVKKALHLSDIRDIYYFEPQHEELRKAKDYWLFCYFANGINPKDVLQLKYKNIDGEFLIFERAKTERATRTDPKLITVYITEDLKDIILRRGNKVNDPDNYIFPIMKSELSLIARYDLVKSFIKFVNDGMAKICAQLGIEKKVTTIVSRHSFSTQLKRAGASTEYIQEALGHADKKTTENYLDGFEKEVKKEFAVKLTAFKNGTTVG